MHYRPNAPQPHLPFVQVPAVQVLPLQHGCPEAPHAAHVSPLQLKPEEQKFRAQHG
jgi:hypothetical protein